MRINYQDQSEILNVYIWTASNFILLCSKTLVWKSFLETWFKYKIKLREFKGIKTHSFSFVTVTLCISHLVPTSSIKPSGMSELRQQAVACSKLFPCLYVSTALLYLARLQQILVDQGSWSCYLKTLTIEWQKDFLLQNNGLTPKGIWRLVFQTLAQFIHLLCSISH